MKTERAFIMDDGNIVIPMPLVEGDGTHGDGLVIVDPNHPLAVEWADWLDDEVPAYVAEWYNERREHA